MKQILATTFIMIFIVNCASPFALPQYRHTTHEPEEIINISEQVGDTVDAEEGQRFGLFTAMEGFKSARFYAVESGGFVIEIETETEKYTALNGDPDMIFILNEYIDTYDDICHDLEPFESKWGILDYDTLGIPITDHEVNSGVQYSHIHARKQGYACFACMGSVTLLASLALLGYRAPSGFEIGPPTPQIAGALILAGGLLTGTITAGIVEHVSRRNTDEIIREIKKSRKPRVVDVRKGARRLYLKL